jgi:DNA-binding NarL/FixJ family response regulator
MSESPVSSPPIRIWLVEDHQAYGERLMRALNRLEGLACERRFTASEDVLPALQTAAAPQVVLLDVGLPGMSGIEAIPQFRALAPQAAIVILTVFEDDDKIFRAICAGAAGYLLKTASHDEIAAALRAAVNGGSPINPRIARRVLEMFSKANANPPRHDYGLSPREQEILQLLVQGKTIKEAASQLGIGFYTADEYIRGVYEKLHVHSRGSAIAKAIQEGLVPRGGGTS